jgi:putative ABC transport system substrate-binding protein
MNRHRLRLFVDVLPACVLTVLLVLPLIVFAETKEMRLVSVSQFIQHPALDALLRGFKDYFESENIPVKYRVHIAHGDQGANKEIGERIAEENPDLVLAISTPSSQACYRAVRNATILFSAVTDPVGAGLVESLDKPGPRITGMTDMSPVDRQLALIVELQPGLKKLGVIYNADESNSVSLVRIMKQQCAKHGIVVVEQTVADTDGVGAAAQRLVGRCDAVYVPGDNTVVSVIESVTRLCAANRLPVYAADVDSVPRGAVVALAIDYYKMGRQTAHMAARIFKGKAPSSMPVESLRDLRIHVNVKAAELMGIELPVQLLLSADTICDSFPPKETIE